MIDLMLIDLILIFLVCAIMGAVVLAMLCIINSIARKKMKALIKEEENRLEELRKNAKGKFVKKKIDMTIYDNDIKGIWVNIVASLLFSSIVGAIGTALFTIIKMVI